MITTSQMMQCRELNSQRANEYYITASPPKSLSVQEQARQLYRAVREKLTMSSARIFQEHIFATSEVMRQVEHQRFEVLGDLDDGIPPTRIIVEPGTAGAFAGVHIHAVAASTIPQPLQCDTEGISVYGRQLSVDGDRWLTIGGLTPTNDVSPRQQASQMFECVGTFLENADANMRSVIRTWLWLKNVCGWYSDLNEVRTAFFQREGLVIPGGGRPRLPASTGIGLGGAGGSACTLDLIASPGMEDEIIFLESGGEQDSAFAYGSAFSRAAVAPMPAGRTLFISGTAAIDAQGRTEHVGQIPEQIESTIHHIRAVLAQAGCDDGNILNALIYCKTPQVERAFLSEWSDLHWPAITLVGDVCRPDLLFEIELVAGPVGEITTK